MQNPLCLADELARQARRAALVTTLRSLGREISIGQLDRLLAGPYGTDLAAIAVSELWPPRPSSPPRAATRTRDDLRRAVLELARSTSLPRPSSWFRAQLGEAVHRWTMQAVLGELVESGLMLRTGQTSATRYKLA